MSDKTFITCAITGSITRLTRPAPASRGAHRQRYLAPRARRRDYPRARPGDRKPSNDVGHYREVMERIRKRDTKLIINLTTGPAGAPSRADDPKIYAPGHDVETSLERCARGGLKPDICRSTSTR
jgi:uncharacterized protein (DUF849 family)